MSGSRLINPDNDNVFELIQAASQVVNVSVKDINDLPKLIEAMETWNYFESAKGTQDFYDYLKDKIDGEMNVRNAETA